MENKLLSALSSELADVNRIMTLNRIATEAIKRLDKEYQRYLSSQHNVVADEIMQGLANKIDDIAFILMNIENIEECKEIALYRSLTAIVNK